MFALKFWGVPEVLSKVRGVTFCHSLCVEQHCCKWSLQCVHCWRFDCRRRWRCSVGHICWINDADYRLLSPTSVSNARNCNLHTLISKLNDVKRRRAICSNTFLAPRNFATSTGTFSKRDLKLNSPQNGRSFSVLLSSNRFLLLNLGHLSDPSIFVVKKIRLGQWTGRPK